MSYSHYRGLGQVPSGPIALPSFDSLPKEGVRYGVPWALVSDDATLNQIKNILVRDRAMAAGDSVRGADGKMRDDGVFIEALKNWWIRHGKNPAMWPSEFRDTDTRTINYNFGPTNNDGSQLRINQALWDLLQAPLPAPWRPYFEGKEGQIGHVRVRLSDRLYQNEIRSRLLELGYITPDVATSISDGSSFTEALKRYYAEARAQGMPVGSWAGWTESGGCASYDVFGNCQNYGPATDGDQIRLHELLLQSLVSRLHNPRVALAAAGAASGTLATRTKPPLYGSLPGDSAPVVNLSRAVVGTASKMVSPLSAQNLSRFLK